MATLLCIPVAVGTPDAPGPPNFLQDPAQEPLLPSHDLLIRDPRWVGALRLAFSGGASPQAYFRALQSSNGSGPHLYLLWHQTADFDLVESTDAVWVGFAVGNSYARVFRILAFGDSNTAVAASKTALQIDSYTLNGDFISGTWALDNPGPNASHWTVQSTVSWLENPNTSSSDWAVAMRVPLVGPNNFQDANGIPVNLGDSFKMFFSIVNWTTTPTKSFAETNWPADTGYIPFSNSNENAPTVPPPAVWGDFQVSGAQPCQAGVSIDASQIKIGHPIQTDPDTGLASDNMILVNTAANANDPVNQQNANNNVFTASINNASGGSVGQINATFRLANWGAIVADDGQWTEVAAGSTGATTPTGLVPITATWGQNVNSSISDPFNMQQFLNPALHNADQCVLVELDGNNIIFTSDSARTNMIFKKLASPLDTIAEISARGLGADPFGTSHRTIYLFVQQLNMPPTTDPNDLRTRQLQTLIWNNQGNLTGSAGASSSSGGGTEILDSPWDVLDQFVPTYKVHAFYETGAVGFNRGIAFNAFKSLSSFGIYANATGSQLFGWDSQLVGAEQLSPDVWRVRVPNESAIRITVRLLAKDHAADTLDHSGDKPTALLTNLCLFAQRNLNIADRVKTLGPMACAGQTNIGTDTQSVSVVGAGAIQLRDRAKVSGSVVSGQNVSLGNGVQVGGGVTSKAAVRLPTLALNVTFPTKNQGPVSLDPGKTATITPGAYTDVSIKSRAALTLNGGGVYYFNSLDLEPQSVVTLSSGGSPVILYVRQSLIFRGQFTVPGGGAPNLFIGVVGQTMVSLEAPFTGTVVVPNGTLQLATVPKPGFTGAFFAGNLVVQPDNTINLIPFSGMPAIEI